MGVTILRQGLRWKALQALRRTLQVFEGTRRDAKRWTHSWRAVSSRMSGKPSTCACARARKAQAPYTENLMVFNATVVASQQEHHSREQ